MLEQLRLWTYPGKVATYKIENNLIPVEIKISQTINNNFFSEIKYWQKNSNSSEKGLLVYGGSENQLRQVANVLSWNEINSIDTFSDLLSTDKSGRF